MAFLTKLLQFLGNNSFISIQAVPIKWLVSYSDSEVESVKLTEEAETSEPENKAMQAYDDFHGITRGVREGPYSPP